MKNISDGTFSAGDPNEDTAIIGDGEGGGIPISMKTLQAVYNEITGKTEELSKRYDESFQVSFSDLEQLNFKVEQALEQYSLETKTERIVIYHLDDSKEQFSSFDRLKIYNKSSTSPTESVLIEYNFLIVLPKTRKAQTYTISVRVGSQIAAMQRIQKEAANLLAASSGVLRFVLSQSAVITIKYVDYMVARNFLTVVDSWFATLHKGENPAPLKFLKRVSAYLPGLGGYPLGALALILALRLIPKRLPSSTTLADLAAFLLTAGFAIFFNYRLGRFLGSKIEQAIHSFQGLGFISLNRGDEQQLDVANKSNKKALMKAVLSTLGTLLVGIASSLIAHKLSE